MTRKFGFIICYILKYLKTQEIFQHFTIRQLIIHLPFILSRLAPFRCFRYSTLPTANENERSKLLTWLEFRYEIYREILLDRLNLFSDLENALLSHVFTYFVRDWRAENTKIWKRRRKTFTTAQPSNEQIVVMHAFVPIHFTFLIFWNHEAKLTLFCRS